MSKIVYKKRKKYKYLLENEYIIPVDIKPKKDIDADFFVLTTAGELTIKERYAWDGASGASDTRTIMRGALVHDALYQSMREGYLDREYRKKADEIFRDICLTDGMSKPYAWMVYNAVRLCGAKHVKSGLLHAP